MPWPQPSASCLLSPLFAGVGVVLWTGSRGRAPSVPKSWEQGILTPVSLVKPLTFWRRSLSSSTAPSRGVHPLLCPCLSPLLA